MRWILKNVSNLKGMDTSTRFRGRARPFATADPGLMSDEVREKVGQYSEQRQAGDPVGGENPRSAAFMVLWSRW